MPEGTNQIPPLAKLRFKEMTQVYCDLTLICFCSFLCTLNCTCNMVPGKRDFFYKQNQYCDKY